MTASHRRRVAEEKVEAGEIQLRCGENRLYEWCPTHTSQTLAVGKLAFVGLQLPALPKGFAVYVNGVEQVQQDWSARLQ